MTIKYHIETWNATSCRYVILWQGTSLEQAETMFNKPYVQHITRRLIKTTEEELYKEKGKK